MHAPLAKHPDLEPLLHSCQWIWDVRKEPPGLGVGSGKARHLNCTRVLTVGTDMAVGKMTVSLEMHRACLQQGLRSRFLATGQTGIMSFTGAQVDCTTNTSIPRALSSTCTRTSPSAKRVQIICPNGRPK
jgi:uncharacterized NAD-dependent epimerase/dehydratase family protein